MRYLIVLLMMFLLASPALAGQNVFVCFDDSGSMSDSLNDGTQKIVAAKAGMLKVLSGLPADSQVGIVCINTGLILPIGPLDLPKLKAAIDPIQANGGTLLAPCMKIGADALLDLRHKERYGTYRLLIVTDGEAQDPQPVQDYTNDLLRKGLTLDVIGVKMEQKHQLATQARIYRNVTDTAALNLALSDAVAETAPTQGVDKAAFDEVSGLDPKLAESIIAALVPSNDPIAVPPPMPSLDNGVVAPTPGSPQSNASVESDGMSAGAITLIVFGSIVGVLIVLFIGAAILSSR